MQCCLPEVGFCIGHTAIVRLLLEKGADANIKADSGRTILYQAAENRHEAIAQLLLEKGADAVLLLFLSFLASACLLQPQHPSQTAAAQSLRVPPNI